MCPGSGNGKHCGVSSLLSQQVLHGGHLLRGTEIYSMVGSNVLGITGAMDPNRCGDGSGQNTLFTHDHISYSPGPSVRIKTHTLCPLSLQQAQEGGTNI